MPQTICSAVLASFVGMFIAKSREELSDRLHDYGTGRAIPLLVWAFFFKPDSSVLVIYGMTLLGGVAYACDQVINTPFPPDDDAEGKLRRGPDDRLCGIRRRNDLRRGCRSILKQRRPLWSSHQQDLSGIRNLSCRGICNRPLGVKNQEE